MATTFTGALTGGLIDPSQPNYGSIAKRSEAARQGLIRLGLQQINAVFGGGTAPFYNVAGAQGERFTPSNTYYHLNKQGTFAPYWAPGGNKPGGTSDTTALGMGVSAGLGDPTGTLGLHNLLGGMFSNDRSPRDIAKQAYKRGQLFNMPTYREFEGFQPSFFEKRARDYVNYALPQVGEQYRNALNATAYGLSNRGLANSSVGSQAGETLERTANTARQTVADTGIAQANQLRRDIEASRQQAIQQLYQSADPAQALQGAVSSAAQFQAPSTFAPVANMFANLANQYYMNQVLNGYRQGSTGGLDTYSLANLLAPTGPITY